MSDGNDVDARHLERTKRSRSADALVFKVLEKCQSEINSTAERQATLESIARGNVRGYGLLIRSKLPLKPGKPCSIWFFPDRESIAIEICYPNQPQILQQFDASDLNEQFLWEQVARFVNKSY